MRLCKIILPLVLVLLLALPAAGAEEYSLTIQASFGGTALPGMTLNAYRVAELKTDGSLSATPDFSGYGDALSDPDTDWQVVSREMEIYVNLNEIAPCRSAVTDAYGTADFGTMERGLYMICGKNLPIGEKLYATAPILVTLPRQDSVTGDWHAQVIAQAKISESDRYVDIVVNKTWVDNCTPSHSHPKITVELWMDGQRVDTQTLPQNGRYSYTWEHKEADHVWEVKEQTVDGYTQKEPQVEGFTFTLTNVCKKSTTTTTTTTTSKTYSSGKLPGTGQLWWPVPLLVCGGLLCLIFGLLRRRKDAV